MSPHDIEIIKRHRRDHNKLGFALQLCMFRFPGWTLSDVHHIPECVVNYIAKQLQISAKEIRIYAEREQTKHEHLEEIRLREQITDSTNKVEAYNGFSKWLFFGGDHYDFMATKKRRLSFFTPRFRSAKSLYD
ncbi:hypothetical protein BHU24_02280 [Bacillus pseudomycoides]|nr:Tn3 family transposase [Bacillus pseudomycoides]MBD5799565.1 hypothetical protein [Bacillus pseudomycoides]MED1475449.1 DUF4158 domain-containing protein [Bacillus pseudomycoides]MED4654793.1 DUF4158 domain-containing protein [Bacillus pseudomycoides]